MCGVHITPEVTSTSGAKLFAGHEREHAAVRPGSLRRTLVLWSSGGAGREVDPEFAAGRPWAPGFPRVENNACSRQPELHGLKAPPGLERSAPRGRLYPVDPPSFDRPA
jgi:hypothetical protein